ncbi:TRAP transporter substrate-binding protein [uncultured Paenalcaligenes sp.]|uniref:TRAP transporter substrate-binding protein n=1 Tax=uncultured Paenalcaligenes sp. TaxID=1588925 RepID=UPI002620070C|nr:TRAP transporter substrate-binding protein [uncultured Paenalcaligenes sp.]
MKLKPILIAGVMLAFSASAAQAVTWRMATAYPEANFHTRNINQFVKEIEQGTDGKLQINVHASGSLIKPPEIKNAVRSRQIEMGEFLVSTLANENSIFALDSVPFMAVSYEDSAKMYQVSKPYLEEVFAKQRMKVLYSVAWPPQGLYTERPIEKIEDLKGMKVRAYSPQTERFAQLAGAIPTQVEAADLAQAFTTGRVNAMVTSSSTGVNSAAWDYLTHYYDVSAFLPKNVVVVNQASFDSLDKDTQKVLLDAAVIAEERGWEMSKEEHDTQLKALADNGIKVEAGSEQLNAAFRKIGETMAAEWSKEAGKQGQEILEAYHK